MIERDTERVYVVSCDYCGHDEIVEAESVMAVVKEIRREGWRPYKKEGEDTWCHRCPSCAAENMRYGGRL